MKKHPTRYETANQIRDEIERYKRLAIQKLLQADQLDQEADKLMREYGHQELGTEKRLEAKRLRKQTFRINEIRLPKLGQKLSEFLTPQLPAIDNGDRSIPRRCH